MAKNVVRVRDTRREAGLCYLCGAVPSKGKKACDRCLSKTNARYARLRNTGLCYCGRPTTPGAKRCPPCRERNKVDGVAKRNANRAAGMCACGNPRMSGKLICEQCTRRNRGRETRNVSAGLCRCGREQPVPGMRSCRLCRGTKAAIIKRNREAAFSGYGSRCACCGETDLNVLQLDHVNNDGNAHRKEIGNKVFKWVVKNNFPPRLQLLCGNCHLAKTRTGDCSYRRKDG